MVGRERRIRLFEDVSYIFLVDLVLWVSFVNKTMAIFLSLKTVKRAFANKIISSCDIKLGVVVSFVIRCAERGVAVAARPTILHLGVRVVFSDSE